MADALPALDAETWVAAISHDLRDPMNAIVGMTALLLDSPLDADQRRCAETVQDAARTMTTLINDLLDLSRLQRGDLRLATEAFDLHQAVQRTLDLVRARIADRPLVLRSQVEPDPLPWVVGDPGRLRQILVNLVGNALTHTSLGEVRLDVTAPPDRPMVTLTVTDTGTGIDADDLARIQEPFVRLSADAPSDGLGLGLAISRHLVAQMGGTLTFASAPGHGTQAKLTLPLARTTRASELPNTPLAGRRIGLAEVPAAIVPRIDAQLRAAGAEVAVLGVASPAAVRLDAVLLGCTAIDRATIDRLATLRPPGGDRLPVLALVASGVRGEAAAARDAGFDGYLPLLAGGAVLAAAVGSVLAASSGDRRHLVTVHDLQDRADGPWRLLVVDDNPMNLRLMRALLERAGHRVETAADGAEGLTRAAAAGFDAVLMDIQMPVLSGLDAAAAIRRLPSPASRVPILAVTANALEGMAATCLAAGMDAFVTKPIDGATLSGELRRVIAAGRAAVT